VTTFFFTFNIRMSLQLADLRLSGWVVVSDEQTVDGNRQWERRS